MQSKPMDEPCTRYSDIDDVGLHGSLAEGYQDHNRAQMLLAIVNLELVRYEHLRISYIYYVLGGNPPFRHFS